MGSTIVKVRPLKYAVWMDNPDKRRITPIAYFRDEKDAGDYALLKTDTLRRNAQYRIRWGLTETMQEKQTKYAVWRSLAVYEDEAQF